MFFFAQICIRRCDLCPFIVAIHKYNNKNNRLVNTNFFLSIFELRTRVVESNGNAVGFISFFPFIVNRRPTCAMECCGRRKHIFIFIFFALFGRALFQFVMSARACARGRGAYKLAHSILYFRVTIDCNKARQKMRKTFFFGLCRPLSTLEPLSLPPSYSRLA